METRLFNCTYCHKLKPKEGFYSRFDRVKQRTIVTTCCKSCRSKLYYQAEIWQDGAEVLCIRCAEPMRKSKTSEICGVCLLAEGRKECSRCHKIKLVATDFYAKSGKCKECAVIVAQAAKQSTIRLGRRRKSNEERIARRHGISTAQYAEMVSRSQGCCYICRQHPETQLVLDKDPLGVLRGLLCVDCSSIVKRVKDHDLAEKILQYLRTTAS